MSKTPRGRLAARAKENPMIKSSFRNCFHTILIFVSRTGGMAGFAIAVDAMKMDMLLALGLCASAAALFILADWMR